MQDRRRQRWPADHTHAAPLLQPQIRTGTFTPPTVRPARPVQIGVTELVTG